MPHKSTTPSALRTPRKPHLRDPNTVITRALQLLYSRLRHTDIFTHPAATKSFLRLQSQGLPHEVFAVMFLDHGNRLIAYEQMFRGTLTHTSVHVREVVKRALAHNAASVVLHHNHPSGNCTPSDADLSLTSMLQWGLGIVEVAVVDHVITSDADAVSMRDEGMLGPAGCRPGAPAAAASRA